MPEPTRFDDAPAYEQFMGQWSRRVADTFLTWLAPAPLQRWLDVGCGNGVLSEAIAERCAPVGIAGNELDYRLVKELWTCQGDRIAVRFAYEWHDDSGNWFRSYGNENWEFDERGFMRRRIASINDLPIAEAARTYRWPLGRRPDDHPGLSDLGL